MTFSNEINLPYLTREKLADRIKDAAGYINLGATSGSSTAYTATAPSWISAYENWQLFAVRLHTTCGSSPSLNINSIGAKALITPLGNGYPSSALASGTVLVVCYDDFNDAFVVLNGDLGRYTSWSPNVTGSGSMTVSSASPTYAKYRLNPITKECTFNIHVPAMTTAGTSSTHVTIDLPFNKASSTDQKHICDGFYYNGTTRIFAVFPSLGSAPNKVALYLASPTGIFDFYSIGAGQSLQIKGVFEVA